jgi:DNA-directed RNA polymerase specialized sigma24 family protein
MAFDPQSLIAAHVRCHARTLHRLACVFGRQRDAEDIVQTLYTRWLRRLLEEPAWLPPESKVELFVCVRRVVMDVVAMENRQRRLQESVSGASDWSGSPEESLHAFERLHWVVSRLPHDLSEVLTASLSAGRRNDALVAQELGLTTSAFTGRLFKARRAAEELASYYELLSRDHAELLAELRFSAKTRLQIANDFGLTLDELTRRWQDSLDLLEKNRKAAS